MGGVDRMDQYDHCMIYISLKVSQWIPSICKLLLIIIMNEPPSKCKTKK